MTSLNYYERLNAHTTATFEELKRNYKQLILQCHPDKLQQQQPHRDLTVNSEAESDPILESDSNFNAINEAWNTLKDPIKRKHYDAELLQSKFQTHSNIYATITLKDMQRTRIELDDDDEQEEEEEQQAEMVEPRLLDSQTDKETTKTTWCKAYAYNCRCGGQYLVDDDSEKQREREQQEQQEESKASEMIVECSECSLVIIVKSDDNL